MTDWNELLAEVEDQYPIARSWAEERQALPAPRWVDGQPKVADAPPGTSHPHLGAAATVILNGVDLSSFVRTVQFDAGPLLGHVLFRSVVDRAQVIPEPVAPRSYADQVRLLDDYMQPRAGRLQPGETRP